MTTEPAGKDAVARITELEPENARLRLSLERLSARWIRPGDVARILAGETPPEPGQPWGEKP